MSKDYADEEREFLSHLEADTGRDLSQWMAAIDAARLTDRNAIIDWLRHQGFIFARASWLERIHNNAGRPIYLDGVPPSLQPVGSAPGRQKPPPVRPAGTGPISLVPAIPPLPPPADIAGSAPAGPSAATQSPVVRLRPRLRLVASQNGSTLETPGRPKAGPVGAQAPVTVITPPPPVLPLAASTPLSAEVAAAIAKARAYAPLAQHLVRISLQTLPAATASSGAGDIIVLALPGGPFAAIQPSPREVRLFLAMPARPITPPFEKPRNGALPSVPTARFTHVVSLTDVRRVDTDLLAAIREAASGLPT